MEDAALDRLLGHWADRMRLSEFESAKIRGAIVGRDLDELDARWWRSVFGCGMEPLRQAMDMGRFLSAA